MKIRIGKKDRSSGKLLAIIVFAVISLGYSSSVIAYKPVAFHPSRKEDAICGVWYTANKNSKVEIYQENGKFYGKVIWLKDAKKSAYNNALVIRDMSFNPSTQMWDSGKLYYPVTDAHYNGFMELHDPDTLLIRVYLGTPFFGKTITWLRAR